MSLFVIFVYLKSWFGAPSLAAAATEDLELYSRLHKFRNLHSKVSSTTTSVLQRHTSHVISYRGADPTLSLQWESSSWIQNCPSLLDWTTYSWTSGDQKAIVTFDRPEIRAGWFCWRTLNSSLNIGRSTSYIPPTSWLVHFNRLRKDEDSPQRPLSSERFLRKSTWTGHPHQHEDDEEWDQLPGTRPSRRSSQKEVLQPDQEGPDEVFLVFVCYMSNEYWVCIILIILSTWNLSRIE